MFSPHCVGLHRPVRGVDFRRGPGTHRKPGATRCTAGGWLSGCPAARGAYSDGDGE